MTIGIHGREATVLGMSTHINRRSFLAGTVGAAVLGACGGSGDDDIQVAPQAAESDGDANNDAGTDPGDTNAGEPNAETLLALRPQFPDGLRFPSIFVAGNVSRAPFAMADLASGTLLANDLPDRIVGTLTDPSGTTQDVALVRHDQGLSVPYYPLLFEADAPGVFTLVTKVNGEPGEVQFAVEEPSAVPIVQPGDPARPVATPTVADPLGVSQLCTRFEPCPFHEVSYDNAVNAGAPTALLISTPAFCQTAVCGPVLELLIEASADRPDMRFVHAEVYTEPERLNDVSDITELFAPVVTAHDLTYEPTLVVADAGGIVTARLDFTWDADELATALATASA